MIEYIVGNVLTSGERVVAHGVNCQGAMGAGIADSIRRKFPEVYRKYRLAYEARVLNLGYCQYVMDVDNDIAIYNLCTQKQMGANGSYWGVYLSFCNMFEHAKGNLIERIAIPMIGCGIAELEWDEVIIQIEQAFEDTGWDGKVVVYSFEPIPGVEYS